MNNRIYVFMLCLSVSLASCNGNKDGGKAANSDSTGRSMNTAAASSGPTADTVEALMNGGGPVVDSLTSGTDKNAKDLYIRSKKCFEEQNATCNTTNGSYCNNDDCIQKIVGCHKIKDTEFAKLIKGHEKEYATFSAEQFHRIVDVAVCAKQRIRFWILSGGRYRMARINDMLTAGRDYKVYFSVALMQHISTEGEVESVEVYKGYNVETGLKLVPFKVHYKDIDDQYYDVSDTEP